MAANRKFGWHSGDMHCRDAKVGRDILIQDDIVFSDVSAGVLGITGGIDMQATTSAIGIDMGGTFSTAAINIDGDNITGRAIQIGLKTAVGDSVPITATAFEAEPGNNYMFGLFTSVADSSAATSKDELRSAWIRTRVNEGMDVGSTAGWGFGVCGAEIQLKVYADSAATDMHAWQNSAVWAQLETQGASGVNFKTGSYSQCVLANVGLTATTTIDAGAVVAGITINSNTASSNVTATGGFYGLFITDKTTTNLDFKSGIFINDAVATTGITIGDCTTGIFLDGTFTTAMRFDSGRLYANQTGADTNVLKIHSHDNVSEIGAAEFKGEFKNQTGLCLGQANYWSYEPTNDTGTPTQLSASENVVAVDTGMTVTAGNIYGLTGQVQLYGTLNGGTVNVAGVIGVLACTGANTQVLHMAGVQSAVTVTNPTTGTLSHFLANTVGTGIIDNLMCMQASQLITNFASFNQAATDKSVETNTGTPSGAVAHIIRVLIAGTAGYIPVYAGKPS